MEQLTSRGLLDVQSPASPTTALASSDSADIRVQVLLEAYKNTTNGMILWMGKTEQVIGLTLTVVGAAIAFGLKEGIGEVFLIVPLALLAAALHALSISTNVRVAGGYNQWLETEINAALRNPTVLWETGMAKAVLHQRFTQRIISPVFAMLGLGIIIFSLEKVLDAFGPLACALVSLAVALLSAILAVSMVSRSTAYDQAFDAVSKSAEDERTRIATSKAT